MHWIDAVCPAARGAGTGSLSRGLRYTLNDQLQHAFNAWHGGALAWVTLVCYADSSQQTTHCRPVTACVNGQLHEHTTTPKHCSKSPLCLFPLPSSHIMCSAHNPRRNLSYGWAQHHADLHATAGNEHLAGQGPTPFHMLKCALVTARHCLPLPHPHLRPTRTSTIACSSHAPLTTCFPIQAGGSLEGWCWNLERSLCNHPHITRAPWVHKAYLSPQAARVNRAPQTSRILGSAVTRFGLPAVELQRGLHHRQASKASTPERASLAACQNELQQNALPASLLWREQQQSLACKGWECRIPDLVTCWLVLCRAAMAPSLKLAGSAVLATCEYRRRWPLRALSVDEVYRIDLLCMWRLAAVAPQHGSLTDVTWSMLCIKPLPCLLPATCSAPGSKRPC